VLPTVRGVPLKPTPRRDLAPTDPAGAKRWVKTIPRPWAIDLFCGAGGLGLGLHNSGIHVVAAADSDADASATYAANLGLPVFTGDLADPSEFLAFLHARGIKRVDIVAGGPPCQPFSRAGRSKIRSLVKDGKRSAEDERAGLWRSFVAVVDALKPSAVLFENVPDMARWNDGAVLLGVLQELRSRGYTPDARVLEAFRFGVPQHRARLFICATKGRQFNWPSEKKLQPTLRDAIGDLPKIGPGQRNDVLPYKGPANTSFQRRARKGVARSDRELIHDHCTRAVRADDAKAFRAMRPGATYRDVPERLRRYRSDIFDDKYKRLEWDGLSRTITAHIAKDAYWYVHPSEDRMLSIREAARIQTFPDWFRFAGYPTVQLRQIGNAVPPALAQEVATCLREALDAPARRRRREFADALMTWHQNGNRRAFPWRSDDDPWRMLLAEMCLRRTRADSVAAVYKQLIAAAPSPARVKPEQDKVRTILYPLGLRWRAENLIRVAEELLADHGGKVPRDEARLRTLTGVGDYVASAVRCFAFGVPSVLLDANTRRITKRFTGRTSASAWTTRLEIYRLAGDAGPTAAFNYALLDFGATVCRPGVPLCGQCPVRDQCASDLAKRSAVQGRSRR
jgi:DNA (cytosine-5)-methyltransferase 1